MSSPSSTSSGAASNLGGGGEGGEGGAADAAGLIVGLPAVGASAQNEDDLTTANPLVSPRKRNSDPTLVFPNKDHLDPRGDEESTGEKRDSDVSKDSVKSAGTFASVDTASSLRDKVMSITKKKKKPTLMTIDFGADLDWTQSPLPNAFTASNVIATTRYSWWSFIPKSLFEQFRRVANVYFLFQAILMVLGEQFPDDLFETPYGSYTVTVSLIIVIGFTMVKEAVEDRKRFREDVKTNARPAWILDESGNFTERPWKDVRVGHIVKVLDRQEMPADLLLLSSVNPDGGCYVETSSIDGETNLKIREMEPEIGELVRANGRPDPFELLNFRGNLQCETPNKNIHNFVGRMNVEGRDEPIAVGSKQFLLRGSQLRNTPWVWGLVVYTGAETKVMKNSRDTPSKLSILEKTMNHCILLVLLTQMVVCALGAAGTCAWADANQPAFRAYLSWTPLQLADADAAGGAAADPEVLESAWLKYHSQYFTFIVLFSNFLPISLYVTVETVLILQAGFIENDLEIYDEGSDTPTSVRTSNLNSDFGQVDFIFSDKTGTLTQNVMKLRQCSVGGVSYGAGRRRLVIDPSQPLDEKTAFRDDRIQVALASIAARERRKVEGKRMAKLLGGAAAEMEEAKMGLPSSNSAPARLSEQGGPHSPQQSYLSELAENASAEELMQLEAHGDAVDDFLTCLTVCHTVVVERQKDGGLTYQAESPDEGALVYGARPLGFELVDRTASSVSVSVEGVFGAEGENGDGKYIRHYEVLAINGFDPTRKRMSIIVRDSRDGQIILFCKGADNKMIDVLHGGVNGEQKDRTAKVNSHLDGFARTGLRTLVMGKRLLSEKEYEEWSKEYDDARTSVGDRDEKLMACAISIERDITLIGASAIEDKLQDGVPEAIKALRASGVAVWVLTGDKAETAKNIGISCQIIEIDKDDDDELDKLLSNWLTALGNIAKKGHFMARMWDRTKEVGRALAMVIRRRSAKIGDVRAESLCLVVHGPTSLVRILRSRKLTKKLLRLGQCCKSVIACRVSPSQKAGIVSMVKHGITPMPVTLAIGDGANDVSMIQEAHLGVGISGKEGLQAVNSSDVAIAQFRFLTRLLLVHGRWNYRRMSKVVLYSFYKNIALTISMMLFQFWCGWSGQSLYDELVYTGFNFFLAFPILYVGIIDQDITAETAHSFPASYAIGRLNSDLNLLNIIKYIIQALFMGCVVFFLPMVHWFSSGEPSTSNTADGHSEGIMSLGTTTYHCLLWAMNIKVLFLMRTWTRFTPLVSVGVFSMLFFYIATLLVNSVPWFQYFWGGNYLFAFEKGLQSPVSWLVVILVSGFVVIFEVSILACCKGKPDVTELLVAYEHGRGPVGPNRRPMKLRMANEVRDEKAAKKRRESLVKFKEMKRKENQGEAKNSTPGAHNCSPYIVTISLFEDDSDEDLDHLIHTDSDEEPDEDDLSDSSSWRRGNSDSESLSMWAKLTGDRRSGNYSDKKLVQQVGRKKGRLSVKDSTVRRISSINLRRFGENLSLQQKLELGWKPGVSLRMQTGFDFSNPSSNIGSASKARREARREFGRTRGESMFNELDNADLTSASSTKRLASIELSSFNEGKKELTLPGQRRESAPEWKSLQKHGDSTESEKSVWLSTIY